MRPAWVTCSMAFDERAVREPEEFEEELERLRHVADPLTRHNALVELLKSAHEHRDLTDLPAYDSVIGDIEALERESGDCIDLD